MKTKEEIRQYQKAYYQRVKKIRLEALKECNKTKVIKINENKSCLIVEL